MTNEPNFEGEEMKLPTQTNNPIKDSQPRKEVNGTVVIILFIILILIMAGLYYWYKIASVIPQPIETTTRPTLEVNKEPETTTATAQTESFTVISTSDEIEAIEADLESTDLNNLETELNQIDAELEASTQ